MGILDSTIGQNPIAAATVAIVNNIIQRVWPDPAQQQAAQERILQMQQTGELEDLHADVQLKLAQIATNTAEASNPSTFVAGWRPGLGWVCTLSMACYYIPYALASTTLWVIQCWNTKSIVSHPDMGISDLIGLVGSMLGFGGLRSYDKTKGIDTKQIGS